MQLYELALEEFLKGLDIDFYSEEQEDRDRGLSIQDEMRTDVQMILERIDNFSKFVATCGEKKYSIRTLVKHETKALFVQLLGF